MPRAWARSTSASALGCSNPLPLKYSVVQWTTLKTVYCSSMHLLFNEDGSVIPPIFHDSPRYIDGLDINPDTFETLSIGLSTQDASPDRSNIIFSPPHNLTQQSGHSLSSAPGAICITGKVPIDV